MSIFTLDQEDLSTLKSSLAGLSRFNLSYCTSILTENFRCCMGKHSIKHYDEGKENIEKRLDITKLVRSTIDIEILKKLYLLPR